MVDVVIPSYQRPELTSEAVQSVLKQSYSSFHLYVIEDGSKTLQLPADDRITLIQLEQNRGPAFCRNYGASLGQADYLAFLDSDDLWHEEKLQKQIDFFTNSDLGWQHTGESWWRDGNRVKQKKIHLKQAGRFLERAFARCLISPSSVMFRRPFWQKFGGFLPHLMVAEDYELWLRLLFHSAVGFIDEPLTLKRAGDWPQLSQTIEIDRYRVLALHRFHRLFKKHADYQNWHSSWYAAITQKIDYLCRGAEKHNRPERLRQYQSWASAIERLC